jgi:hypothetical protein
MASGIRFKPSQISVPSRNGRCIEEQLDSMVNLHHMASVNLQEGRIYRIKLKDKLDVVVSVGSIARHGTTIANKEHHVNTMSSSFYSVLACELERKLEKN